jgi:hypothetical protein
MDQYNPNSIVLPLHDLHQNYSTSHHRIQPSDGLCVAVTSLPLVILFTEARFLVPFYEDDMLTFLLRSDILRVSPYGDRLVAVNSNENVSP